MFKRLWQHACRGNCSLLVVKTRLICCKYMLKPKVAFLLVLSFREDWFLIWKLLFEGRAKQLGRRETLPFIVVFVFSLFSPWYAVSLWDPSQSVIRENNDITAAHSQSDLVPWLYHQGGRKSYPFYIEWGKEGLHHLHPGKHSDIHSLILLPAAPERVTMLMECALHAMAQQETKTVQER